MPNELQRATLPTLTNEECNERGHNVGPREICTLSRFGQGKVYSFNHVMCIVSDPFITIQELVEVIVEVKSDNKIHQKS